MIVNAILQFLGTIFNFVFGLLPKFTFIDSLIQAKEGFLDFVVPIMEHTLYVFNIPVLSLSVKLLYAYVGFVAIEYVTKLCIKYFVEVV